MLIFDGAISLKSILFSTTAILFSMAATLGAWGKPDEIGRGNRRRKRRVKRRGGGGIHRGSIFRGGGCCRVAIWMNEEHYQKKWKTIIVMLRYEGVVWESKTHLKI
jgi:hypothetical protein